VKLDRWQRIEGLFYQALDLEADTRPAFLDHACQGDERLRKEVDDLLQYADKSVDLLESAVRNAAHEFIQPAAPKLASGTRLDHYEIVRLLGAGGMGEVYVAQDIRLKRNVALKILRQDFTRKAPALRRFEQEAQTLSALNHPNIVTIFEFGEVDDRHFLVEELIEGESLRDAIEGGELEFRHTIDIAVQVSTALSAAHASGVIHRDIKPENIIIRPDGLVKVLDFGIAKLEETPAGVSRDEARTPQPANTEPGMVLGTLKYMSPEQARGFEVDARSDIFSVGAVLYEMATGRPAFSGETSSDIIADILKTEPPALTEGPAAVSPEFQKIIDTALSKDRAKRYQTAKELLTELQALQRKPEAHATNPSRSSGAIVSARVPQPRRKSLVAALVAIVLVALITGYVVKRRGSSANHSGVAPRSLAVLPFRNLRPDPETDFLGFSLADAIITKLGYVNALTVRPSSAIERFETAQPISKARRRN
jgi:serine/threonine protein kinase